MIGLGADVETIAEEMQRRFGFRPREAFRHAHGWSQEEAADHCNRATGDARASFNGTRISEYERWPFTGRRPTLPVLTVLARAYGTVPRRLVDYHDLGAMPVRDRPALEAAAVPLPAEPAEQLPAGDSYPEGGDSPEALTEQEVVMAAADQASEFGEWAEMTNVGPVTLAQIEAATRRVAHEYLAAAPLPVFMRTMLLGKRVFRLLQGHQQPGQTRELYLAAGRLYALLAWMSGDLGYLGEAEAEQLDGAVAALEPVLAIWPEQRLDPVTRRMREVGRALISPRLRGSASARALQGQVEDFCAASLPAQLPT
jgi:hypothetical protein